MKRPTRKQLIMGTVAVLIVVALIFGFLPDPVPVRTEVVERAPLQVVVEEEGETRVRDRYVVSSPVAAFARRVDLEVGDPVAAGQPLVRLESPRAPILDPRSRSEAGARVEAARAAVARATEDARAAEAAARQAIREQERTEALAAAGAVSEQALERAITEATRATAAADAASAAVLAARADQAAAQAAFQAATGNAQLDIEEVLRAPAPGRVLAVHHRSEGLVNPGEPLVEVGDTERLEVWVDLRSQDAVRIRPGMRVQLDDWGGAYPLEATVQRIEPQGFTAVTALGVEEQRVPVIAGVHSDREMWQEVLGAGYRVLARFIVWEDNDVLQVPTSALFRFQDGWAVFVVEDGRAVRRSVTIGQQAGLAAQVLAGVEAGEPVIVHPPNTLDDGARVQVETDG
jgi:HlyD family secretion protein